MRGGELNLQIPLYFLPNRGIAGDLINNLNGQFGIGFLEGLYQGFVHTGIALKFEGENGFIVAGEVHEVTGVVTTIYSIWSR